MEDQSSIERRDVRHIPRLSTADAQRERQQAYRSPSASSSTAMHCPFASPRSNVFLSTARPGYIRRAHNQRTSLSLGLSGCAAAPGVKPRLLVALEAQLAKGDDDDAIPQQPGEQRLRLFRDAFQMFMGAFGVYRGVLNRIRSEYDAALDAYARQARFVAPLKARLISMKDDAQAKIASIALACKREKAELEQRIAQQAVERERDQEMIANLNTEVEALRRELDQVKAEQAAADDSRQTLMMALNRYSTLLDASNAERVQLSSGLDVANDSSARHQASCETLLADLNAATLQLTALQARFDEFTDTTLLKELARSNEKAQHLEREFADLLNLYESAVGKRADIDLHRLPAACLVQSIPGMGQIQPDQRNPSPQNIQD